MTLSVCVLIVLGLGVPQTDQTPADLDNRNEASRDSSLTMGSVSAPHGKLRWTGAGRLSLFDDGAPFGSWGPDRRGFGLVDLSEVSEVRYAMEGAIRPAVHVAPQTDGPETELGHTEPGPRRGQARLLPGWVEVLSLSAGVALLVVGTALVSFHETCRGDPLEPDPFSCSEIYSNRPQDLITLGTGGTLLVSASVLLAIDEGRMRSARRQGATLMWEVRF